MGETEAPQGCTSEIPNSRGKKRRVETHSSESMLTKEWLLCPYCDYVSAVLKYMICWKLP